MPNEFEFISPDGKYFYSKKLDFMGREYMTIYSTNTEVYKTANYVDLFSSNLAILSSWKLGWQIKAFATIGTGAVSPVASLCWMALLGV
jgi:hypothetical protein|tara:strand:- start:132 stop:398 length:267 start_codon:yes stop_codon:yes gene_type:complete